MPEPNQSNSAIQQNKNHRPKAKTAPVSEQVEVGLGLAQQPADHLGSQADDGRNPVQTALLRGPEGIFGSGAVETQVTRLNDPRLSLVQRQMLAAQIGRVQGNQHLQRVVALSNSPTPNTSRFPTGGTVMKKNLKEARPVGAKKAGPGKGFEREPLEEDLENNDPLITSYTTPPPSENNDAVPMFHHLGNKSGQIAQRAGVNPASLPVQRGFFSNLASGVANLAGGIKDRVLGQIAGFARRIPGYPLLTVILGKDPISGETVERNATNLVRGLLSFVPGGDKIFQNLQESQALEKAFAWLSEQVAKLGLTFATIKGLFRRAWDALSPTDLLNPWGAFNKIKNIFMPMLARIKNFAVAIGQKILEFVFEGALKLAGPLAGQILGILKRAGGVFSSIIKNPMGFLGNLIRGVKQGLLGFVTNIGTHLKKGLMTWLFGALSGAGIQLPAKFDLKGILSLVMQVLGLTWANIRAKAVKMFGEGLVGRLEGAFEIFKIISTEGLGGLWEYIKEMLGDLKTMVIDGIKEMVITQVIKAGIQWLVGILGGPAGAVIKAIKAIYDIIMWFITNGRQLMSLVNGIINSISAIASGAVGQAAQFIEQSLARAIPVVISFLASLLGLGGISTKIKKIIKKIQQPINKAIKWVLDKAKAAARKIGRALGFGKDKEEGSTVKDPKANARARSKARQRVSDVTKHLFKDDRELKFAIKRIETDLKPEGLESLQVTPKKGKIGEYDIIARQTSGEDVGDAQIQGTDQLPFNVGNVVSVWWDRRGQWTAATVKDIASDIGGKSHVKFWVKVTKRTGQKFGGAGEAIFIAVDEIKTTEGKKWRRQVEGTKEDPAATRVKPRQDIVNEIKRRAKKTPQGDFIDPNTGKVVPKEGPYHIGHKPNFEWWKTRDTARAEGWTREQVIEHENNPDIYQIEDPGENVSHKHEAK